MKVPEAENAVLIVEDDEATAELERLTLSRSGLRVRTVSRVNDAIDLLRRQAFSAVLLDYQLPDGDPWLVLQEAQARVPRIPVIIVTAMGNERVAAEAIHRGVAEYVPKTHSFWDQLPGVVQRVARLAQAEEDLQRRDELFRLISENTSDWIVLMDLDGSYKYVSPASRHMFGQDPEELIGHRTLEFVHPDDCSEVEGILATAATTHKPFRLTYRHRRKDGSFRWVEAQITTLRDPTGVPTEMLEIVRDITDRKELEARVAARTEQIHASLREKEVLLKEIHHRVKNNLQVISSLLNLQAAKLDNPSARSMFAKSQDRVYSIALVHEKLYQSPDLSHVNFDEYVRSLVQSLFQSLDAANRGVAAKVDVSPVRLSVDKAIPCALIINELVTNSLKHAFPTPRTGSVNIRMRPCGGEQLELTIEDDGIGFPTGVDPRAVRSLGLDLVFTFADQLGAGVDVQLEPGTAFSFRFSLET